MTITHAKKTKLISLLMVLMLVLSFVMVPNDSVFAASSVKIGQATNDENGKTRGGTPGDQTGKEVSISSWSYSSKSGAYNNWKYVYRAKNSATATKLAKAMKDACNNNYIGYDQTGSDRGTLYDQAKKLNWNIAAITTRCETTCASVVSVCLNAAGVTAPKYFDSTVINSFFKDRTDFYIYTSSKYTASDAYLEPGDILVSPGKHTCMVVSSGNAPGSTNEAPVKLEANYSYKLLDNLNVRTGPGTSYPLVSYSALNNDLKALTVDNKSAVLKKGAVVNCLEVSGNWIKLASGWICGRTDSCNYVEKGAAVVKTAAKPAVTKRLVVGKDYKLKKALYVRRGPGTNYAIKKRAWLSSSARKYCYNKTKAMFKKNTVVTCLEVKGDWIRVPSGWVCAKKGNIYE